MRLRKCEKVEKMWENVSDGGGHIGELDITDTTDKSWRRNMRWFECDEFNEKKVKNGMKCLLSVTQCKGNMLLTKCRDSAASQDSTQLTLAWPGTRQTDHTSCLARCIHSGKGEKKEQATYAYLLQLIIKIFDIKNLNPNRL